MAYRRRELPAPAPIRYNPRPRQRSNWKEDLALSAAQTLLKGGLGFGEMAYRGHLEEEAAKTMHEREMAEAEARERRLRERTPGTWEWEQLQLRRFGGPEDAAKAQAEEQAKLDEQFATDQTRFSAKQAEYEQSEEERAKARKAYGDYLTRGISVDLPAVDIDLGDVDVTARGHDPFPHSGAGEDVVPTTVRAPSYTTERKGSEGEQAARRLTSQVQGFFPGQGLAAGEGLDPALRPRAAVPSLTTRKKSPAAPAEPIARSAGKVGIGGVKTAKAPAAAPTIPEALDKPVDPVREIAELRETRGQRKVREQRELADLQARSAKATELAKVQIEEEAARVGADKDLLGNLTSTNTALVSSFGRSKRGRLNEKKAADTLARAKNLLRKWGDRGAGQSSQYDALKTNVDHYESFLALYIKQRKQSRKHTPNTIFALPIGTQINGKTHFTKRELDAIRKDNADLIKAQGDAFGKGGTATKDLTNNLWWITTHAVSVPNAESPQPNVTPPGSGDVISKGRMIGGGKGSGPAATQEKLNQLASKAEGKTRDRLNQLRDDNLQLLNRARTGEVPLIDPDTGAWTEIGKRSEEYKLHKVYKKETDQFEKRLRPTATPTPRPTATGAGAAAIRPEVQASLDKIISGLNRGNNPKKWEKDARNLILLSKTSPVPGEHEAILNLLEGKMGAKKEAPAPARAADPVWSDIRREEKAGQSSDDADAAAKIVNRMIGESKNMAGNERQSKLLDARDVLEAFKAKAGRAGEDTYRRLHAQLRLHMGTTLQGQEGEPTPRKAKRSPRPSPRRRSGSTRWPSTDFLPSFGWVMEED